jgi:uncharacterized membrane protein YtjA (UPF0391 family)
MLRRKRKNKSNGSEVQSRLNALRADLDALQKDMRGLMSDVGDVASKEVQGAMGGAIHSAQEAAERLEDWEMKTSTAWETQYALSPWLPAYCRWARVPLSARSCFAEALFLRGLRPAPWRAGGFSRLSVDRRLGGYLEGVGFGAYAIYVAFVPALGLPWASAAASGLLLAGPLTWVLVMQLRRPQSPPFHPRSAPRAKHEDKAVLQLLAGVAKEKPLLAVLFAGLIGAAETVRRRGEDWASVTLALGNFPISGSVLFEGMEPGSGDMFSWALTFLVLAVVSAYFGFFGLAGMAAVLTKLLLVVFLVLLAASGLIGLIREEPPI